MHIRACARLTALFLASFGTTLLVQRQHAPHTEAAPVAMQAPSAAAVPPEAAPAVTALPERPALDFEPPLAEPLPEAVMSLSQEQWAEDRAEEAALASLAGIEESYFVGELEPADAS